MNSKIIQSISNFIKIFDNYALPLNLKFKRKNTLQTSLSGKISFVLFCIMGTLTLYLYLDLISKVNQKIITFPFLLPNPPPLNISMTDIYPDSNDSLGAGYFFFYLKVKFAKNNSIITKEKLDTLFFLEIFNLTLYNGNVSSQISSSLWNYTYCKNLISKKDWVFDDSDYNSSICVENTTFFVVGDFISPQYSYQSIKFKNCTLSTNQTQKNNCNKNFTAINLIDIEINFIYTTFQISSEYRKPGNLPFDYFTDKIILKPTNVYLKNDVYLTRHKFISEDNLYIPSLNKAQYPIVAISKIRQMVSPAGKAFISYFLRSDYPYNIYYRKYKTFLQLLSQLGGVWTILYVLGGLLMISLNSKLLKVEISNKRFNLIEPNINAEQETYRYITEKLDKNEMISTMIKINNKTQLECIAAIEYYKYERNKGLRFTISEAFISIACFCCVPKKIDIKDRIFSLAFQELDNDMDISNVIRYCQQFNFVKKCMLGDLSECVGEGYFKVIHSKKNKILNEYLTNCLNADDNNSIKQAYEKEVHFINGIRSFKFKPILDQIDVNLLKEFKLKKEFIKRYFINHMHIFSKEFDIYESKNDKNEEENMRFNNKKKLDLKLFD